SNFEAFSRVLLEAMAMETPYVATDGGGNIRTYTPKDHQPFILSEADWNRFPDKIIELLEDSARSAAFVSRGKAHVQKFALDTVVDTFLKTVC
ncbi:MAG TPA: glycosyltransferase, partial [bacterium]|nr:glycosyltransferase [bacterium]